MTGYADIPVLLLMQLVSDIFLVAIGLLRYRHVSTQMRILVSFVILHALTDFAGVYLATHGIGNHWLHHIYTPIEFAYLFIIFALWEENTRMRKLFFYLPVGFAFICLIFKLTIEQATHIDSLTSTISRLLLLALTMYVLIQLFTNNIDTLFRDSRFWVAVAVMTYVTGTLVVFILGKIVVTQSPEQFMIIWSVSWISSILANTFYAGGLFCRSPQ